MCKVKGTKEDGHFFSFQFCFLSFFYLEQRIRTQDVFVRLLDSLTKAKMKKDFSASSSK
jgi:hypothetical protein